MIQIAKAEDKQTTKNTAGKAVTYLIAEKDGVHE